MKEKLRLDVDALHVDTFAAQESPTARGTVNAHDQVAASGAAACGTFVFTTPCCPASVSCPPTYTCP
jgi:hypothetical protein